MSLYQELGKQLFDALNSGQSIGPLRALIDNDIDAAYAAGLRAALAAGVEALAYDCVIDLQGITLGKPLDFQF